MSRQRNKPPENPYGVDQPITRMALCLIYLATGTLPKGFSERWKDVLPFDLTKEEDESVRKAREVGEGRGRTAHESMEGASLWKTLKG